MLHLRPLSLADEPSFRAAVQDCQADSPPWLFAFDFDPTEDFANYVQRVNQWPLGQGLRPGHVPNTYLLGLVDGTIVGRISIRHELNDFLLTVGGHIGYGVLPSARRKGYATEMLRQSLNHAAELGITRALLTCDTTNTPSRRVIERCGGVFESTTAIPELDVQKHRFWIDTSLAAAS